MDKWDGSSPIFFPLHSRAFKNQWDCHPLLPHRFDWTGPCCILRVFHNCPLWVNASLVLEL